MAPRSPKKLPNDVTIARQRTLAGLRAIESNLRHNQSWASQPQWIRNRRLQTSIIALQPHIFQMCQQNPTRTRLAMTIYLRYFTNLMSNLDQTRQYHSNTGDIRAQLQTDAASSSDVFNSQLAAESEAAIEAQSLEEAAQQEAMNIETANIEQAALENKEDPIVATTPNPQPLEDLENIVDMNAGLHDIYSMEDVHKNTHQGSMLEHLFKPEIGGQSEAKSLEKSLEESMEHFNDHTTEEAPAALENLEKAAAALGFSQKAG